MADSFNPECPEQFPSFVSFIGTTGVYLMLFICSLEAAL